MRVTKVERCRAPGAVLAQKIVTQHLLNPTGTQDKSRSLHWAGISHLQCLSTKISYSVSCAQFQEGLQGLEVRLTFRDTAQIYQTFQLQIPPFLLRLHFTAPGL